MSSRADYSEQELIVGIRRDDPKALGQVYRNHYPSIANLIRSNNGTEQEAKDIYQEAVIVLYEKLKSPEFELTCQISTFLYAVSRRLWLKRLSEKNKFSGNLTETESYLHLDTVEQEAEESEKRFEIMAQALDKLGEPCKTVLEDFYLKKMSMQEITDKMGYTNPDNAKNQKYKCLQRLKKLFFQEYKTSDRY